MNSTKEKVSYCIGLEAGSRLKSQFAQIDPEFLKKGFLDAVFDEKPALKQEEVHAILENLQRQIESQQKDQFAKLSEHNKKESEQFFTENKHKEGVQTLSSGLQYKILHSAADTTVHPTILDEVTIHYRGTFINGQVFDSSYQRGEPTTFPLNRVIAGWAEIVQLMSVGDKWQVFIPPYLAYAEMGFGPEIGPNKALIFEIELLKITG